MKREPFKLVPEPATDPAQADLPGLEGGLKFGKNLQRRADKAAAIPREPDPLFALPDPSETV